MGLKIGKGGFSGLFGAKARNLAGLSKASEGYDTFQKKQQQIFSEQLAGAQQQYQNNPYLATVTQPLEAAQANLAGLKGGMNFLPGALKQSALASTAQASQAAAQTARLVGGGRGGLAYGGGAALAARASQQAASGQAAALANALVSGQTAVANYNTNLAGMDINLAQALAQGRMFQSGTMEDRNNAINAMRGQYAAASYGLAGGMAQAGMQGEQQYNAAKNAARQNWFGMWNNIGSSWGSFGAGGGGIGMGMRGIFGGGQQAGGGGGPIT